MTTAPRIEVATPSPNPTQAERLKLGVAVAQTAYELNNGYGIAVGKPLRYFDDSALLNKPGIKPLDLSIDDGYMVTGVFNDPKTGLNAFFAYSKDKKELLIGIAGTNGFGEDGPDSKEDVTALGMRQARTLVNDNKFRSALQSAIQDAGATSNINNVLIAGQSLGGGVAPSVAMMLVYGDSARLEDLFYSDIGLSPAQISVVSVNGFGNEYTATNAGFSPEQIAQFNAEAELNRLVVHNSITGEYDLVSRLGGKFSGTSWLLEVEESRGIGPMHRMGAGVAEAFSKISGDLTQLKSGQVPAIDHKTISRNLALLDASIPIANNAVSLSWAGYVAMLFSMPGEGAGILSASLHSYAGIPKPLADVLGALGEFVLRALPVNQAAQTMRFLLGTYLGGQLIGSSHSAMPPFDVDGAFGPAQAGWNRHSLVKAGETTPSAVIDTNPVTRISVIRQIDGRSVEIHPDGSQILTHPDFGLAVIRADGSGMLYLKEANPLSGELSTATVALASGTQLIATASGWTAHRKIDEGASLYETTAYAGIHAKTEEVQLEIGPDGEIVDRLVTKSLSRSLPSDTLAGADPTGLRQYAVPTGPGQVRLVLRDDDRRIVQTIDVLTTDDQTESTYKDGQGNLQKVVTVEQLNADAVRTTITGEQGELKQTTVVQRYRRHGELYELEDHTDNEEGLRILTVRDSNGFVTRSEAVPIGETPAEYMEAVRDSLDNDIADFLTALRQKDTAGIILSSARIALDYARSQGIATLPYDTLAADASSGLALISALRSLQSGDTLAKAGGTVGLLNSTDYFAARLTGSGYLSSAQSAALSQAGALLAIANLANLGKMVEAGQIGSAGATAISAINGIGYLSGTSSALMGSGALIAVNPIVMVGVALLADALFGEDPPPPPPRGTATFYREADGQLAFRLSDSNKLGERILHRELSQLLPALESQLAAANAFTGDAATRLNLVASRMPTIQISGWPTYEENGVNNYFFVMAQRDPMRDDPSYLAVSRVDLVKLYAETLLLPEAVVQQWELDHLRAKFGNDETHWQTEGEWLRGRSPVERERSRLQGGADQARARWEAASKVALFVDQETSGSSLASSVKARAVATEQIAAARQAMDAATATVEEFNARHPVDPLQAARATPAQEAAFAVASGSRQAVALQWLQVVAVDLGNDGVAATGLPGDIGTDLDSLREQRVARFDVDGDGFREATQWIAPADAILGIDRNGNGVLDSGSELFNGADTPFDQHGFASLAFYDANGDGLITRADPVYRQLRLWVDLDGDGSAGQLEVFDLRMHPAALPAGTSGNDDLEGMAVEAIDLNKSTLRFADGGTSAVVPIDLLSHLEGLQIVDDEATGNLNVLHEGGLRENFITLADDMSALQELLSPTLPAARRAQLEALAVRYGLNPQSEDFSGIVRSLQAAGTAAGEQNTVIYFGDDDVWVDPAVRERLEQMRITFRKLGDSGSDTAGESQLVRIGAPLRAEVLASGESFDDRWIPSRRVGAADIESDAAAAPTDPETPAEQQPVHSDIYSLLEASKGTQVGGLDARVPVIIGETARHGAPDGTQVQTTGPTEEITRLGAVDVDAREDTRLSFNYTALEKAALRARESIDPASGLRLIGLYGASHGTVTLDEHAGLVAFRPEADYAGAAGFLCVLADTTGRMFEQEVRIRLQPLNDAPRVAGEAITSVEDVPLLIDPAALLANDRDVDADSLEVIGIARVALGRAELLGNGQIHYTPPSDQYGVVDTLDYIVQDSQGASAVARLRITLNAADDAPSVVSERVIHAREDQTLRISPHLLLRNDIDVDTDSRIGSGPLKITGVGSPVHGQLRMEHNGEIVFTADRNFNGEASFSYTVMDESGLATTGRALLRIDAVNDAPLAAGEQIASREDEPLAIDPALLLTNDIDTDIQRGENQVLSVVAVDAAIGGQVKLDNGMISFVPDANRSGNAGFRYTISDGAGGFVQASVDIDLAEVNDAPVLPSLRFDAIEDTELALPASRLLEGATDADGDTSSLRVVRVGHAAGGTVTLVDGQLRFRPGTDFAGSGSFDYTVADSLGAETTGTVAIDINRVNDAPVLMPGSRIDLIGNEDQEIRIAESALVKMFWDADGDRIRIDIQSLSANNSQDRIRYDAKRHELVLRAAPNANGTRRFKYTMTDGQLSGAPQTLLLKLRPVNDAPVVNAVGFAMIEDGGETNPTNSAWSYLSHQLLLSGATDIEGDVLRIVKVAAARTTGVANPAPVELLNDETAGRIGIRAPLNYSGAIEFEFTVADGQGGETTQKAYGLVSPLNDTPYLTVEQTGATQMTKPALRDLSTWQIGAWDPDATAPTLLAIERNPLRGTLTLGTATGAPDSRGGFYTTASISTDSGKGNTTTTESATFSATDSNGAQSQISLSFTGRYSSDPIVIDFGRDGLKFIELRHSAARFDVDGQSRRSAWIDGGEGILALDVDQDGRIDRLDEIAFGSHVGQPSLSDLQALQDPAFDRNQDAVFDARDPMWSQFFVWQDRNGNGSSDTGELRRLDEAGIEALYLHANVLNRAEGPDVRVRGYTRVRMNDGSLLQAADVWLGLESPEAAEASTTEPSMQQVTQLGADQFAALLQQLAQAPQEGNRAPMVYGYLPVQFALEGQPFRLELAPNFFIDADTADPLRIDARLADGSALPAWLRWDPERLLLEGMPQASDAGFLQLMLTATDRQGASTQLTFSMLTEASPDATANVPDDVVILAGEDLRPADLALSRLLSSVATGNADTGIVVEPEAMVTVPIDDGIGLPLTFGTTAPVAASAALFDIGSDAATASAIAIAFTSPLDEGVLSPFALQGTTWLPPSPPYATSAIPSAIPSPTLH